MYIGIAGNIGSGKTSLTKLLTESFGWKAHYETTDDNPYLTDFYADMQRWSFQLQVYFLTHRFESIQRIRWTPETIVQDRTIYEDAYIFAENLYHMGLMAEREYRSYMDLFKIMSSFLTPPDLLIYLKASVPTLVNQIQKRQRSFEVEIKSDYLSKLNERYDTWIEKYPGELLVINVDDFDFVENTEHIENVVNIIGRTVANLADIKTN
jgi:deoxyadenosine/deoxycytidine kinase